MKIYRVAVLLAGLLVSSVAFSECVVADATITRISQYQDGIVFVYFDKLTDCPCTNNNRMAIHKDEQPFVLSSTLTAFAAGKTVRYTGYDTCTIHGNTAKIKRFDVYK